MGLYIDTHWPQAYQNRFSGNIVFAASKEEEADTAGGMEAFDDEIARAAKKLKIDYTPSEATGGAEEADGGDEDDDATDDVEEKGPSIISQWKSD